MVSKERMSEALKTITREFVDVSGILLKWNPIKRSLFRLAGSEPRRLSDFVGSMKFVAIKRATMVELRFVFLTRRKGHAVDVKPRSRVGLPKSTSPPLIGIAAKRLE